MVEGIKVLGRKRCRARLNVSPEAEHCINSKVEAGADFGSVGKADDHSVITLGGQLAIASDPAVREAY
jgi:hypothetical protein